MVEYRQGLLVLYMSFRSEQSLSSAKSELLSPVGDWDCLLAAIANGADAVYLGTREFNARINARNFSLPQLGKVIAYSHRKGVRVYLTMNILVKNHEIEKFFATLSQAYEMGIDGVIIQHTSFLEIIKKSNPGLAVFLSTQAAIGNADSASLFKSADRIILPREVALEEIRQIVKSGVRVEVFVHGALCFSCSGLCLFSSFVGNRSGNRGSCAQLCRQRYNGSYLLSTKELCVVKRIPELIQAGITGFKIEGRMRSALYVAVATRLYRKAIDSYLNGKFMVPEKERAEIEVVFNREFTEGLLFDDKGMTSPEKPMNRGAFLGVMEGDEIVLRRSIAVGDGVGIWKESGVKGAIIEKMCSSGCKIDSAIAGDRVNLGISDCDGVSIYLTSSARIRIKPDFNVAKLPLISSKRQNSNLILPRIKIEKSLPLRLLVKVYSLKEAGEVSRAGGDIVFYDVFSPDFPGANEWEDKVCFGAYVPRLMNDAQLSSALHLLREKKPEAILTGNLGLLFHVAEFTVPVYLDYSINSFNDIDNSFFQRFKVIPLLSPELSLAEMTQFRNKRAVIFCHGDIVLVTTLIDPGSKQLIDDKGSCFPVRKEDSYWQILNSRPFGMFNDIRKLRAAGFSQFFIDKQGEGAYFAELYKKILSHNVSDRRLRKHYTAGHLYRQVA